MEQTTTVPVNLVAAGVVQKALYNSLKLLNLKKTPLIQPQGSGAWNILRYKQIFHASRTADEISNYFGVTP
jgi:hypothetical protein